MAYIRSLSTRANLFTRRCHSSIPYILHHHHHHHDDTKPDSIYKETSNLFQNRTFGTTGGFTNSSLIDRRCFHFSVSPTIGASFSRQMSTSIGEGTDEIELMTDVAEVLSDSTVQAAASQAPAVNEVAIAAADSFFPVALLQHFIDAVHSFTGFNWWASIVLATLLVKGATIPLMVNRLKAGLRLQLMAPHLKKIQQKVRDGVLHKYDGRTQSQMLHKEYNLSYFTIIRGHFIQFPVFICFFLALSNMAEKVPSLKSGGAYWFLDLSTPDTLYVFPLLTALTFWINVEARIEEAPEGDRIAKNLYRGLAVLLFPLTMGLPKAILCYLITSQIFHLAFGLGMKLPRVTKFLGREMSQRIRKVK